MYLVDELPCIDIWNTCLNYCWVVHICIVYWARQGTMVILHATWCWRLQCCSMENILRIHLVRVTWMLGTGIRQNYLCFTLLNTNHRSWVFVLSEKKNQTNQQQTKTNKPTTNPNNQNKQPQNPNQQPVLSFFFPFFCPCYQWHLSQLEEVRGLNPLPHPAEIEMLLMDTWNINLCFVLKEAFPHRDPHLAVKLLLMVHMHGILIVQVI